MLVWKRLGGGTSGRWEAQRIHTSGWTDGGFVPHWRFPASLLPFFTFEFHQWYEAELRNQFCCETRLDSLKYLQRYLLGVVYPVSAVVVKYIAFSKQADLQSVERFSSCERRKANAAYTRNWYFHVASPSSGASKILTGMGIIFWGFAGQNTANQE